MAVDNETREPTGFPIYEDRLVTRPAQKHGEEDRTIIVRDHATLDYMPADGTRYDADGNPVGHDHTNHGRTEYLGRFIAQGGRDPLNGGTLPARVLTFPIPARTLYLAFKFLEDRPAVAAACTAALDEETKRLRSQVIARQGSGLLIAGGNKQ